MASSSRRRRSNYNLVPGWLTRKRAAVAALVVAVAAAASYGGRVAIALGHLTRTDPLTAVTQLFQKGSSSVDAATRSLQRLNIAVYGYGGAGHDGAYLTDSIMILSIQPQRDGPPLVAEVSVPRDFYVPVDLGGGRVVHERINAAYENGMDGMASDVPKGPTAGGLVANRTIEQVLGIHIDHWVGVDFTAFKAGVDAMGGVDVTVPHTFTDYQYPRGECGSNGTGDCALTTVHFDAGPQHMDGQRALEFSRSRHSLDNNEGTDFARSRRQQLVVAALKQKVVSIGGLGKLPDLLNALGDHVVTDMKVNDGEALYELVKDVDPKTVEHVSIDDTNFLYECGYPYNCGAAYLYAHDTTFASLHRLMANLMPPAAVAAEHVRVTVLDGSGGGRGASGRWTAVLGQMGLATTDGGAGRLRPATHVIDGSGGTGAALAGWLGSYFGVPVEAPPAPAPTAPAPAPSAAAAANGGVTLILGQDEERAFHNTTGAAAGLGQAATRSAILPRVSAPNLKRAPTSPGLVVPRSPAISTP